MLNLYPYNSGHLMVVPYRHVADYTDLTDGGDRRARRVHPAGDAGIRGGVGAARVQHRASTRDRSPGPASPRICTSTSCPRWGGDTNFMPVIGQTRVLPQLLAETRTLLAEAWSSGARD